MSVIQKLDNALWMIKRANGVLLRDPKFLAYLVRYIGLVQEPGGGSKHYGSECVHCNQTFDGLYQIPGQFSEYLVYLHDKGIKTALEVGTWSGWTAAFMTAYLKRFEPTFHMDTVDPHSHVAPDFAELCVRHELPMSLVVGTSADFRGQKFDLVFIDGDHSYEAVKTDWENVGQYAKYCSFHDVNEDQCPGVEKFWKELLLGPNHSKIALFDYHPDKFKTMGIGVIQVRKGNQCQL